MSGKGKLLLTAIKAIMAVAMVAFSVPTTVFAAKATPASDQIETHVTSQPANHLISFRTPTGIDAPTDTITLNLSSFTFGALGAGDVDISHGPVTGLETPDAHAAAAGLGVWGVGVAGGVVTLTPPTNAAPGTVPAGNVIVVKIGTNALGGVNRLTNPAAVGTGYVNIGGGFGDSNQMAIPIIGNDGLSVGGTVLQYLTLTNINPNSAVEGSTGFTMTLTGTHFATSSVARIDGADRVTTYVTTTQLLANILTTDLVTAASKNITVYNPSPGITSNALVFTINSAGGPGGGGGDTTPPVISNVQAINITETGARIVWDTDESATSRTDYGLTTSYGDTVSNGTLVMSHGLDLSGLTPNTMYHFTVTSADQYGNTATSLDYTFTTLPSAPLVISNVTSTGITDVSSIIVWDTNRAASSKVLYGLTSALGMWTSVAGDVVNHAVTLTSLTPGTLYYYQVTSMDSTAQSATSSIYVFTTSADHTPPTNVTLSATPGDTVVRLDWTLPSDPDFAGTRIMRRTGGYPTGPLDGTVVYSGPATTTLDTGLTNGITYYYAAYAYDTNGNYASGALASATPVGTIQTPPTTTPPIIPPTSTPPVIPPPVTTTTPPVVTPPSTTTTPPVVPSGLSITVLYYSANGTVLLQPDENGVYGVLGGASVLARIPTSNLGATAQTAFLTVGGHTYSLTATPDGTAFTGTFIAPTGGVFPADARVVFTDSRQAQAISQFMVQAAGSVAEQTLVGPKPRLPGAEVTLEELQNGQWVPWNGAPYGQSNPLQSGPDGSYVFVVPNGTYRVQVQKNGYQSELSVPVQVRRNVFGDEVSLIKYPVPVPTTTIPQTIAEVPQYARFAALNVVKFVRSQPVEDAVEFTVPAVVAVSIVNAASAFSLFNLLAYLQFLFTQPIMLFGRMRRKRWGAVYNSLTKQPVEFAIVRLIHQDSKLVVQTRVTDKRGRYFFLAKKGSYMVQAVKPGFDSPSQFLSDVKQDLDYPDVYHGETINLQQDGIIAFNIPLDPMVPTQTPRGIVVRKYLKRVQHAVAILGVVASGAALVIAPSFFIGAVFVMQIALYSLFRRLSLPAKAPNWGRVYDAKTRKPLGRAVVRIFDKKFNKLLETQLTDNDGGFGFIVGRSLYYVTVEKPGFGKYVSKDIDFTASKETVVDMDVGLTMVKPNS